MRGDFARVTASFHMNRPLDAGIAQLVEHDLAKVGVAGSSPVSRSILALFVLVLAVAPVAAQGLALAPGDPIPRVDGGTLDNELFTADWSSAKLTIVNFWGTDCDPCRLEMAELQGLWREKRRRGLRVIGVVTDGRSREEVAKLLKGAGIDYTILFPSDATRREWMSLTLVPSTFLVGPDGKIRRRYVGADPASVVGLRADVLALLEGKAMPPQVLAGPGSGENAQP